VTASIEQRLLADQPDDRAVHAARASLHLVANEAAAEPAPGAYIDTIDNPVLRAMLQGLHNVGQRLPEL